jgi:hypothetical protein
MVLEYVPWYGTLYEDSRTCTVRVDGWCGQIRQVLAVYHVARVRTRTPRYGMQRTRVLVHVYHVGSMHRARDSCLDGGYATVVR